MSAVTRGRLTPNIRVGMLVLGLTLCAGGANLLWLRHWGQELGSGQFPMLFLAGAFALFEMIPVHLEYREEVHSVSLSELALVAGLIFFPPSELLIARLAGSLVALVVARRQWNIKLPFNLASFALEAAVATSVYRLLLSGHPVLSGMGAIAIIAGVLSANAVGTVSVASVISLHEWRFQTAVLGEGIRIEVLGALVMSSVGMLACGLIWAEPGLSWLMVVVAALACLCFRGYAALRQRYASLDRLYTFNRSIGSAVETGEATHLLLTKAAELLRAAVGEIILFDEEGTSGLRSSTVDGAFETAEVTIDRATSLEHRAAALGCALLASRVTKDPDLIRRLAWAGYKDAMVVPLRRNGAVVGTFLVANRLSEVTTFDAEDLKLFETVGLHASATLENGRLIDQLRQEATSKEFQSLHDNLTGLANRTLFHRLVAAAIESCREGRAVAVMLMDLDRFKEVNDTLGHHTGDLLLIELSNRLRQVVGDRGEIARLGGDEFAILLPDVVEPGEAEEVTKLILAALERPLALAEINLQIGASVGLALFPNHAGTSDALLQLADVAMYQAKANHTGYAVYASKRNNHDARRLALAADLRSAVERDEIVVHYQPKANVKSRQLTGVEALVRWEHPGFGLVPPDEFVPIAEHTGLIRLLTDHVLEAALRQCRSWRRLGFPLGVAVNLSVRNLMDRDLPDRIGALLSEVELPAAALTLEITEGTIMADPARTLEVLNRLAAMGIRLSIDDFGTGYSSLSYLKRLPVHEVKIDKSFVQHMTADEDDLVIVRSVVDLARNLRLGVVAEGVENASTWACLADLGCDSIQGFYLSRPLEAGPLTHRLLTRGTDVDNWVSDPGLRSGQPAMAEVR